MVESPVTLEELLAAVPEEELPANRRQRRSKPRASGLAGCARAQTAYMLDEEPTNFGAEDAEFTAEQGRIMEEPMVRLLERAGLVVNYRQLCIGHEPCSDQHAAGPLNTPYTGHPDGGDLAGPEDRMQGLKWGVEFKHLGRWKYEGLFKNGLEVGAPDYLAQMVLYGSALQWDACLLMAVAQDASSTRSDATTNLRNKDPKTRWAEKEGWNPKFQLVAVDLREYRPLAKMLWNRAEWLGKMAGSIPNSDDVMKVVAREYDPTVTKPKWRMIGGERVQVDEPLFPCGYCEFLERCVDVGQMGERAPLLPFSIGDNPE